MSRFGPRPRPPEERFWEKVDKSGNCWLWTASTCGSKKYGWFRNPNGSNRAHVYSYELAYGPVPEGYEVDHQASCLKICVRPEHLRATTRKQNLENLNGANAQSKSGVRGVHWSEKSRRWVGQVTHNYKNHFVGHFTTIKEAEAAVIAKRLELFTHNDMDRNSA